MWSLKLTLLCAIAAVAFAIDDAVECDPKKCLLPNCVCQGSSPQLTGKIPQFVALTFDDSVSKLISDDFYQKELFSRKNPDNCPISGTFYVPHEYTDYSVVNLLYNKGFEIGSHSITKNYSSLYWSNATADLIKKEMGGQRDIIAHFANISQDVITGARIPQFLLNNDHTYDGLQAAKFQYDNSWPTYASIPLFPYTLDYFSDQKCVMGTCPKKPHKGFWVVPMNNWQGMDNEECNKIMACDVKGNAKELFNWMMKNFQRHYEHRIPVSLSINYAWFTFVDNSLPALQQFLDHLKTLKDVFVVSNKQIVDWMKNPVPLEKFKSCQTGLKPRDCTFINCKLKNAEGSDRYMGSCVKCPKKYPSIDDPLGEGK